MHKMQEKSSKKKASKKDNLSQELIDAAKALNFAKIQSLIQEGADVNYVRYTDANCWYSGNTHTALYEAVHSDFKEGEQENYIRVLQYLL